MTITSIDAVTFGQRSTKSRAVVLSPQQLKERRSPTYVEKRFNSLRLGLSAPFHVRVVTPEGNDTLDKLKQLPSASGLSPEQTVFSAAVYQHLNEPSLQNGKTLLWRGLAVTPQLKSATTSQPGKIRRIIGSLLSRLFKTKSGEITELPVEVPVKVAVSDSRFATLKALTPVLDEGMCSAPTVLSKLGRFRKLGSHLIPDAQAALASLETDLNDPDHITPFPVLQANLRLEAAKTLKTVKSLPFVKVFDRIARPFDAIAAEAWNGAVSTLNKFAPQTVLPFEGEIRDKAVALVGSTTIRKMREVELTTVRQGNNQNSHGVPDRIKLTSDIKLSVSAGPPIIASVIGEILFNNNTPTGVNVLVEWDKLTGLKTLPFHIGNDNKVYFPKNRHGLTQRELNDILVQSLGSMNNEANVARQVVREPISLAEREISFTFEDGTQVKHLPGGKVIDKAGNTILPDKTVIPAEPKTVPEAPKA